MLLRLTLLRCLMLLRGGLPLLWRLALLWRLTLLRGRLALWFRLPLLRSLALLWSCLALWFRLTLLRSSLPLLRYLTLLWSLTLLLLNLPLLCNLALLLWSRLAPIHLILVGLVVDGGGTVRQLSRIRTHLRPVALLCFRLIASLHCRGGPHVAVCRKWLLDGHAGWTAMVYIGKLRPIGAGNALILDLGPHGRCMSLMASRQLRRPGAHLQSTRSSVEAHTRAAAVVSADAAVVDVMHHGDIHVVD